MSWKPSHFNSKMLCAILIAMILISDGCYSFKGTSIPVEVTTFYIGLFDNQVPSATPTLPRDFTEKLRDKIRR
jgi:hypothetical protein